MMRKLLITLIVALWQLTILASASPEPVPTVGLTAPLPQAVVLSVHKQCDYSEDGKTFTKLKAGHVFNQGAIVRTGKDALVDLFFKRIGTTVRLQSETEVKLEKMARHLKEGMPVMETLLDLRKGRLFTVVRALIYSAQLN